MMMNLDAVLRRHDHLCTLNSARFRRTVDMCHPHSQVLHQVTESPRDPIRRGQSCLFRSRLHIRQSRDMRSTRTFWWEPVRPTGSHGRRRNARQLWSMLRELILSEPLTRFTGQGDSAWMRNSAARALLADGGRTKGPRSASVRQMLEAGAHENSRQMENSISSRNT